MILPATTNAVRLVEEVFAVAQRLLGILVDGDRDGLDVLVTVPFPRRELPDFRQRLNERRRGSVRPGSASPTPPSQHLALPGKFSLSVPFGAKAVDFVEHPLQQQSGRSRRNSGPLELEDFPALASYLGAHVLDFGTNVISPIALLQFPLDRFDESFRPAPELVVEP